MLNAKTSAEWETFLAPLDVMCEPVRAPEGVLQSEPQVWFQRSSSVSSSESNSPSLSQRETISIQSPSPKKYPIQCHKSFAFHQKSRRNSPFLFSLRMRKLVCFNHH